MLWASARTRFYERHIHRLGNLTLCGDSWNPALSNYSFERKKEIYRNSSIAMTRRLAEFPKWDEAAIKQRADELAQEALRLWPWTVVV